MPAETPQGVPESVVFQGFDGLKNTVDRERLGARDLAVGVNIDLDDDGQPHRRRGRTLVASGKFHSLWNANDGTCYGVKNGDLGIIEPDYFFTTLVAGVGPDDTGGNLIQFEQIGDLIYFTSPYCSGIITHSTGTVEDWGPSQSFWYSPVVDPTATLPAIAGKLYGGPPRAGLLVYFNGRMYLADKKMLWATVLNSYTLVDKTRGFIQFEDEIVMLAAVADGLYVGTTEGVWFLQGASFEKLKRTRVMDSPVIPGSAVEIPAELANPAQGPQTQLQVSIAFMTTRGYCVGEDGGHCVNLTEAKFFFPVARSAAAFFRRQDGMNHYIACLDADGSPVNGARIGAYVDPELQRFQTPYTPAPDRGGAIIGTSGATTFVVDEFVSETAGAQTKTYGVTLMGPYYLFINGLLQTASAFSITAPSTLVMPAGLNIQVGDTIEFACTYVGA